jgi:SAM-dependent methyltransferase
MHVERKKQIEYLNGVYQTAPCVSGAPMNFRRQLVLVLLKRFDRDAIVQLLVSEHRPGSFDWWRVRWWRWLMQGLSADDVFSLIYAKKIWGSAESRSGSGSTLNETVTLRRDLLALLHQLKVTSLLDIPCGDFNWMSSVELGNMHYVGADIVPELVAKTALRYAKENRGFLCLDLITDPLPKTDVIFCRDCLVHLPNREVLKALSNIRASGSTYLLTTTFPDRDVNDDIPLGYWRPINLERPPFSLPPPIASLHEGNPEPGFADKSLGVWRITEIPSENA